MKRIKEELDQESGIAAILVVLGAAAVGFAFAGGVIYGVFRASEAITRIVIHFLGV